MARSRRFLRFTLGVLVLGAVGAGGYWAWQHYYAAPTTTAESGGRGRGAGRRGGPPAGAPGGGPVAVPVTAAAATRKDVPLMLDALGTVQPLNSITVRPQVEGVLTEIAFREGQDVKVGDVLARIDSRTYAAALAQAEAKKAYDQAQLNNGRVDLQRYQGLLAASGITRQQVDTQRAQVAMFEAQVAQDQAAIDSARTQLDYTVIRSPIDGRVGLRQVDPGNLVRSSDTNGLVTVTQLRPIAITFTLPQQELPRLMRAMAAGSVPVETVPGAAGATGVAVGSNPNSTAEPVARGTLLTVDNQVDAATGTVKAKAVFPNDDQHLWPGAFVNLRLRIEVVPDATVVPVVAVQQGPNGAYVFVVGDDNKVAQRAVALGPVTQTEAVLRDGLREGERVVTSGGLRLNPGTLVAVAEPPPAPTGPAPGTDIPGRQRRPRQAAEAAR
ncbi:efflux RND transporter periplasmic adaptor subunit [Roseomonas sp. BN140053]|uniref:efflux RND transporter periplasmic adaptor subunit n=1 Tax=Roseomonas sp. BN140053 TaxID=3391898 RepID=UPI0039EA9655